MSPMPQFLVLWTNSKKPRYKGRCSWEIPRWGRSQERSKDQNPLHRVDMNFVEAITIFVPRIFPGVVADGLVLKAPFR